MLKYVFCLIAAVCLLACSSKEVKVVKPTPDAVKVVEMKAPASAPASAPATIPAPKPATKAEVKAPAIVKAPAKIPTNVKIK